MTPLVKEIHVKIVPQSWQRYDTRGDYWWSRPGVLQVQITNNARQDWREAWGVLLHELFEAGLVMAGGVSFSEIDAFDQRYHGAEPGTHPSAPYHREHMLAMEIEEMFYQAAGWSGAPG